MSFTAREIEAPPSAVFAVLADPTTYPEWLVGASDIREVEPNFPSPGAKFHHMVGVKPFVVPDSTEVIDVEPDRRLKLRVRTRPFVVAEATFELVGDDERCVVTLRRVSADRAGSGRRGRCPTDRWSESTRGTRCRRRARTRR